jgi:hypothetical protein
MSLKEDLENLALCEAKYTNCLAKIKQHSEQIAAPLDPRSGIRADDADNPISTGQRLNQQDMTLKRFEALKPGIEAELLGARITAKLPGYYPVSEIFAAIEARKAAK